MKKNYISGIIFIVLFGLLIYTYYSSSSLKSQNATLKQQLIYGKSVKNGELNKAMGRIIQKLNGNQKWNYATKSEDFKTLELYGIRTLDNYKNELNIDKFKGSSYGAIGKFNFSSNIFAKVYIIKNTTDFNGNIILSDIAKKDGFNYYSLYRIGNFFIKIDIYNTKNTSIPNESWQKIYKFTSEIKEKVLEGISNTKTSLKS